MICETYYYPKENLPFLFYTMHMCKEDNLKVIPEDPPKRFVVASFYTAFHSVPPSSIPEFLTRRTERQ